MARFCRCRDWALGAVLGAAAYAWFEAGWEVMVPIDRLHPGNLGVPSRGRRAVERAVEWVEGRQPDLTLISGDLVSRWSGEPFLRGLLARLPNCYAVLGNHDYAIRRIRSRRRLMSATLKETASGHGTRNDELGYGVVSVAAAVDAALR